MRDGRRDEAGRGVIAFLVALVVVGFTLASLKQIYDVKHKADILDEFTDQTLRDADRKRMSDEDVKTELMKKIREVRVPITDPAKVSVVNEPGRWHVTFEWDDTVAIPGYPYRMHFRVDRAWVRY